MGSDELNRHFVTFERGGPSPAPTCAASPASGCTPRRTARRIHPPPRPSASTTTDAGATPEWEPPASRLHSGGMKVVPTSCQRRAVAVPTPSERRASAVRASCQRRGGRANVVPTPERAAVDPLEGEREVQTSLWYLSSMFGWMLKEGMGEGAKVLPFSLEAPPEAPQRRPAPLCCPVRRSSARSA